MTFPCFRVHVTQIPEGWLFFVFKAVFTAVYIFLPEDKLVQQGGQWPGWMEDRTTTPLYVCPPVSKPLTSENPAASLKDVCVVLLICRECYWSEYTKHTYLSYLTWLISFRVKRPLCNFCSVCTPTHCI